MRSIDEFTLWSIDEFAWLLCLTDAVKAINGMILTYEQVNIYIYIYENASKFSSHLYGVYLSLTQCTSLWKNGMGNILEVIDGIIISIL